MLAKVDVSGNVALCTITHLGRKERGEDGVPDLRRFCEADAR